MTNAERKWLIGYDRDRVVFQRWTTDILHYVDVSQSYGLRRNEEWRFDDNNYSRRHMDENAMSKSQTTNPNPHPLAWFAGDGKSGAGNLTAGDRFIYDIDGRHGWADEFLSDGDALVTFDDGTHETVKWNHMSPEAADAR